MGAGGWDTRQKGRRPCAHQVGPSWCSAGFSSSRHLGRLKGSRRDAPRGESREGPFLSVRLNQPPSVPPAPQHHREQERCRHSPIHRVGWGNPWLTGSPRLALGSPCHVSVTFQISVARHESRLDRTPRYPAPQNPTAHTQPESTEFNTSPSFAGKKRLFPDGGLAQECKGHVFGDRGASTPTAGRRRTAHAGGGGVVPRKRSQGTVKNPSGNVHVGRRLSATRNGALRLGRVWSQDASFAGPSEGIA